jgi:hypothetical protein
MDTVLSGADFVVIAMIQIVVCALFWGVGRLRP